MKQGEKPTITEDNTTVIPKVLQKESLSLQEQVDYVKEHFKSEGLFLTLDIKKISKTQSSLHGVLYEIDRESEPEEDVIIAEGMLTYQINDESQFKEQALVVAFNLGDDESLADKIKYIFKHNTSTAFGQVANVITSVGIKIFG